MSIHFIEGPAQTHSGGESPAIYITTETGSQEQLTPVLNFLTSLALSDTAASYLESSDSVGDIEGFICEISETAQKGSVKIARCLGVLRLILSRHTDCTNDRKDALIAAGRTGHPSQQIREEIYNLNGGTHGGFYNSHAWTRQGYYAGPILNGNNDFTGVFFDSAAEPYPELIGGESWAKLRPDVQDDIRGKQTPEITHYLRQRALSEDGMHFRGLVEYSLGTYDEKQSFMPITNLRRF